MNFCFKLTIGLIFPPFTGYRPEAGATTLRSATTNDAAGEHVLGAAAAAPTDAANGDGGGAPWSPAGLPAPIDDRRPEKAGQKEKGHSTSPAPSTATATAANSALAPDHAELPAAAAADGDDSAQQAAAPVPAAGAPPKQPAATLNAAESDQFDSAAEFAERRRQFHVAVAVPDAGDARIAGAAGDERAARGHPHPHRGCRHHHAAAVAQSPDSHAATVRTAEPDAADGDSDSRTSAPK